MSMDYTKTTYRRARPDTRFRTSYSLMSQWMPHTKSQKHNFPTIPDGPATKKSMSTGGGGAFSPYVKSSDPGPSGAEAALDETAPIHLRYGHNSGYDDFHRAFRAISQQFPSVSYPTFGPPRLRHGRAGGSWRHVKEVLQAGGSRIVFVDGQIRWNDQIIQEGVPGGNLIQPKASNTPTHRLLSRHEIERERPIDLKRRRMTDDPETSRYDIDIKRGLENDNWLVMR